MAIIYFIDYITYPPERLIALIKSNQIRPAWVVSVIFFVTLIIYFMRPKIKHQFEIADTSQEETTTSRQVLSRKIKKSPTMPRHNMANAAKPHPLLSAWTILRLGYIYFKYLRVGMLEESFYIAKANCFLRLQWYDRAIISYEKALKEADRASVHSILGYCYYQICEYDSSIEHYRKAYKRLRNRSADIRLAEAELKLGYIDKSDEVIQELRKSNFPFKPEDKKKLDVLEAEIAIAKRWRH
jgi:tetratricopeptide (TPR) repeat protein